MDKYEKLLEDLKENQYHWVVTGAAGFIGSNLVHTLLEYNQKVVAIDDFSTGHPKNIEEIKSRFPKSRFEFKKGDIRDFSFCKGIMAGADRVLHQAAIGSVPRSIEDPLLSHSANVDGFLKVLLACKEAGVKKMVYASSSSVYGDHEVMPKVEAQIGNPLSPYAATKLINEIYANVFQRVYDFPIVGLRYFNVFGPRQSPDGPYAAVIPLWAEGLIDNTPTYINGKGDNTRDFCYIKNVIQANLLAAFSPNEANGQLFNIAFGEKITLVDLHKLISETIRKAKPDLNLAPPTFRDERPGDIKHSLADTSKAEKLLGYQPKYSIAQGLVETIDFIVHN